MLAVSTIIAGTMIPLTLSNILTGGYTLADANVDTSILTMWNTLFPIMIIVAIILGFVGSVTTYRSYRRSRRWR